MIKSTMYTVPQNLLNAAQDIVSTDTFRYAINKPTGNFFYDPWEIKEEFKGTLWQQILNTLPDHIGEARIIILNQADCYSSHSDIDDRWHLTISSKCSYLINLDNKTMFELNPDGIWYDMDAGPRHTAVNFGNRPRIQLVVRKLLTRSHRQDLINIEIITELKDLENARYEFDNSASEFLNKANKEHAINNFSYNEGQVSMSIAPEYIECLQNILGKDFKVKINDR